MSKNKLQIEFDGFDKAINKLNKLGSKGNVIAETALKETHKIVTKKAEISAQKPNLPAKGKYSTGQTLKSIKKNADIEWNGTMANVSVGFSISKGGLASIFMMYGTPRYMKNQKMWDAFWSKKTRDEIKEIQEKIFYDEIRRLKG